jgi:hypothetical protein
VTFTFKNHRFTVVLRAQFAAGGSFMGWRAQFAIGQPRTQAPFRFLMEIKKESRQMYTDQLSKFPRALAQSTADLYIFVWILS